MEKYMEKYILGLLDILRYGGKDRLNTISQLKEANKDSLIKVARNLLEDTDVEKRMKGIEGLMVTDPEKNVELILPLLSDPDPDVRWEVVYWIKRNAIVESGEISNLLIKALREDPSPDVRTDAAEALGMCRTPEAKSALLWAANQDFESDSQGYSVSEVAKAALKRIASSNE